MFLLYCGWALIIPLFILWHQKTIWETKAKLALNEATEAKDLTLEVTRLKIREKEIETSLKEQEKSFNEKMLLVEETKGRFTEAFKVHSLETMEKLHQKSNDLDKKKEEELLKKLQPVKESLSKLDEGMRHIEKERKGEQAALKEQIESMLTSEKELKKETVNLVNALKKPDVRGMWGELQLKRVVELAGMVNHCDFYEQNVSSDEESRLRPDMIIRLPGDKQVIVDAKAPFEAFLEANQTEDPARREDRLKAHARHLRNHVNQLAKKSYWRHFQPSPEFVILFLPAEIFFQAALQQDASIIEMGAQVGVVIATPTTMIGLLRAISHGWKQDLFSKNAREISDLGHELYKRLSDMNRHWAQVGKALTHAVDGYNKALGSFERRVLVSARKLKDLGAGDTQVEIETPTQIEALARTPEPLLEDLMD